MTADSDREAFRLALPKVLANMAAAEGEDAATDLVCGVLARRAAADPRITAALKRLQEIVPGLGLLQSMKALAAIGRLEGWE